MAQLCEGLTILDLSQGMAGSLATMVLADGGAEVIKIEPPRGDWARSHPAFIMWNRGKKSVVLDLKTKAGQSHLQQLARSADVMVTTVMPAAERRLGLDHDTLAKENPGLVSCSITGFGPMKKFAHLKGYDAIVNAKTGRVQAANSQIEKDGPRYTAVLCGTFGAAMYAITGIMAALYVRERTGKGQRVETSLAQALFAYDWGWLGDQLARRPNPPKPFLRGSPTPQYFTGRSKDGVWFQFANSMSHLFVNFLAGLGLTDLLAEERYQNLPNISTGPDMEELYEKLHVRLQEKTADEWLNIFLHEVDAACEPFLTTQQAFDHPQVVHNRNFAEVDDPAVGHTRQLGPLVQCSETPLAPQGPAPALGEHTREVLASIDSRKPRAFSNGRAMPRYPLEGVTVVEFATWFAAPFGTAMLADLGADIVKIESLDGDSFRRWAATATKPMQGKRSLAIDLKMPEGQKIAHEWIKRADLMMHNFRPGVTKRLGIDYETCRRLNPRLVYLYGGSYGSTGPYSHRPAMHPIPGAICGGALYQAGREMPPPPDQAMSYRELRQASSILFQANEGNPDVSSALGVGTALLLGLYNQQRTGQGQYMETTMLNTCLYAEADDYIQYEGKPDRLLSDGQLNGLHALYRFYKASEGWVFLACVTEREWRDFCEAVGRTPLTRDARFATPEARLAHDDELVRELEPIFLQRTAHQWELVLAEHGVACAELSAESSAGFAASEPAMREAGLWVDAYHPSLGDYQRYGGSVTFSACENRLGPTVYVGEHTRELLQELGYADDAIEDLKDRKVVTWSTREADPDA
ncbi:MAG: CoA transferase [Dehalococcoidia bacterium]